MTEDQIRDASGGGLASSSYVRKLRKKARLKAHPVGQDILGITDLHRRAGSKHDYVKAVIQKGDYAVVIMETDSQAAPSGKPRFIQADSMLVVVAAGGATEGVAEEAIRSSAKRAFDWDLFNNV